MSSSWSGWRLENGLVRRLRTHEPVSGNGRYISEEVARKSMGDERRAGTNPWTTAFETDVCTIASETSECFCTYLCCGLSIHHVASPIVDIAGTRRKTSPRWVCDTVHIPAERMLSAGAVRHGEMADTVFNFAFPSLKC